MDTDFMLNETCEDAIAEEYYREKYIKEKRARKRTELELRKAKLEKKVNLFDSFMKILVAVIVTHGLICVTASYVYAWHGIMEPLESLSETIAREIVGPVITYGLTKTIENVSKYNDWIDKFLSWKYGMKYESSADEHQVSEENYGD